MMGMLLVVILGITGVAVARNIAHRQQVQALTRVCQAYLVANAHLPAQSALNSVRVLTVPSSQARLSAQWISQNDPQRTPLLVRKVDVHLSHVTIRGQSPVVLRAAIVVDQTFGPRGYNRITESGTFHLTGVFHPRLEAVSFNTDPAPSALKPSPFTLNLWGQVPAGPLPHGS